MLWPAERNLIVRGETDNTAKVLILYRRHDSDVEVWCYRTTGEMLTLLEASPRDRGRKWESVWGNGERLKQGFKWGTMKVREATRRGSVKVTVAEKSTVVSAVHTCTYMNKQHLPSHSKWGGVAEALHLKLWAKTWNCSCMLQSILLSSLCQRLDCVPLSQWNQRQEMRWRMKWQGA